MKLTRRMYPDGSIRTTGTEETENTHKIRNGDIWPLTSENHNPIIENSEIPLYFVDREEIAYEVSAWY